MACDGYTKVWELAPREILRLDGARGTTVRVTHGTLWLTLEDDARDVVLSEGESFTIDRGGLTVIEAQGSATVCAQAWYIDATRIVARPTGVRERVAALFRSAGAADLERRWAPYY
jgi:pseudouridine-5'-phosphate glycosidase